MTDLQKLSENTGLANTDKLTPAQILASQTLEAIETKGANVVPWREIANGQVLKVFDQLDKDLFQLKDFISFHIIKVLRLLTEKRWPNHDQIRYMTSRIASYVVQYGWTRWDVAKFFHELPDGTWGEQFGTMQAESVIHAVNNYNNARMGKIKSLKKPEVLREQPTKPDELVSTEKSLADVQAIQARIEASKQARKPQRFNVPKQEKRIIEADGKIYEVDSLALRQAAHQWEARAHAEAMAQEVEPEAMMVRHGGNEGKKRFVLHLLKKSGQLMEVQGTIK